MIAEQSRIGSAPLHGNESTWFQTIVVILIDIDTAHPRLGLNFNSCPDGPNGRRCQSLFVWINRPIGVAARS